MPSLAGPDLVHLGDPDTWSLAGATGDVLAVLPMNVGGITIGNRQGIANQGTSAIAAESKGVVETSPAQVRLDNPLQRAGFVVGNCLGHITDCYDGREIALGKRGRNAVNTAELGQRHQSQDTRQREYRAKPAE